VIVPCVVTVALRIMDCPAIDGLALELTVVVVGARMTGGGLMIITCEKVLRPPERHNEMKRSFRIVSELRARGVNDFLITSV